MRTVVKCGFFAEARALIPSVGARRGLFQKVMLKDTMELVGVWQTDNHQDSEERPPPEKDVHGKKRKKKKAPAKFIAHYDKMTYTKRNGRGSLGNCFCGWAATREPKV